MNTFFYLAVILFSGLIMGRIVMFVHLPNVTGYLIAGLLIGPYCLKFLPVNFVESMHFVSELALAFIAFSIGSEFKITYLKKVGMTPIVIAFLEAFGAVIFVTLTLWAFGFDFELALLLGAIASATAPAATIMVIKQYKAKGILTETLMSVVALDDAAALIAFGFASAVVTGIHTHVTGSIAMAILSPFLEIIGALILGSLLGFLFKIPIKYFKQESNRTIILCAFVFLGTALAEAFSFSSLLLCMAMGAVFTNVSKASPSVMKISDAVTPPIFVMFFVVSGAEFNISILPQIGLIGIIYIITRVIGKIAGASLGAVFMHAEDKIRKYIGLTLVPQAGVAIGLSLIASEKIPLYGETIRAVILCATLIYELIGPGLTKMALNKAGEIPADLA